MKNIILLLGVAFTFFGGVVGASGQESGYEYHRFYQPELTSTGGLTVSGKWRQVPAAQLESPRTWVAPFLESESQIVPRCSLTSQAGLHVTSAMGILNPLITIRVSSGQGLTPGISQAAVLQTMIECIQLNMKHSAFFNVRLSFDKGVSEDELVRLEGSYTVLKGRGAA